MKTLMSTGIKLSHNSRQGWSAEIEFSTMEHAQPSCIEGRIGTRYSSANLSEVVDRVMVVAKQIDIQFLKEGGICPAIYVEDDGDDPDLPSDWREIVGQQCTRLGWKNVYTA